MKILCSSYHKKYKQANNKKKIEVIIQPCRKYFLREIENVIFSEEHLRSKVWLENNK